MSSRRQWQPAAWRAIPGAFSEMFWHLCSNQLLIEYVASYRNASSRQDLMLSPFCQVHYRDIKSSPTNVNPTIARTALYITNDHDITIGRAAIDLYFAQNAGRPVKLKKVWVGEVEVYGADMYYVTDVYAWVDNLSPGRLFLSIKSGLSDAEYQGTMVGRFYYSLRI